MHKRAKKGCALFVLALLVLAAYGAYWFNGKTAPVTPGTAATYYRVEKRDSLANVLQRLESEGIIRSALVTRILAKTGGTPAVVREGTYRLGAGMGSREILTALQKPVRMMVRIPETNWALRNSKLLEEKGVLKADEYMELVRKPSEFKDEVSFPLPESSLEGYLYPDTYDLPPLLGARETIIRQLRAFETKVWKGLNQPKNLERAIIVASMVELEVASDEERPMVAGVIENRIKRGMPLQIDATINYALQKWRPLTYDDYRNVDSPYNTYRTKELPPGPICSPSVKSIQAALKPTNHNYLFYVAMPGTKRHMFAENYGDHLKNVQKRRDAMREAANQ